MNGIIIFLVMFMFFCFTKMCGVEYNLEVYESTINFTIILEEGGDE